MNFLKKLFGGGGTETAAPKTQSEVYEGFTITPGPINEGGEYRIAALIEKDGRSHQLIRADTTRDPDDATESSVLKAKQMIDEQGDGIFR